MNPSRTPTTKEHFQAILDHIADGVVVQDANAQIVYLNPAATRLLGFKSADEAIAVGLDGILRAFEVFDDRGDPLPRETLPGRQALQGAPDPARIVRVRPAGSDVSGSWRWAWVKASPIQGAENRPEYVVNIFQEITELKQTELGLKEANQRILDMLEDVLEVSEKPPPMRSA